MVQNYDQQILSLNEKMQTLEKDHAKVKSGLVSMQTALENKLSEVVETNQTLHRQIQSQE